MTIKSWLQLATNQLSNSHVPSGRLDAELILSHTLNKPRTWIHSHDNDEIDKRHLDIADARLSLRLDRVPLAYIIGHKEFYGRRFQVTSATLIPRPESEAMIELLKDIIPPEPTLDSAFKPRVVDVGTGSGILGITAKLERPHTDVTLLDVSRQALNIAEKNAEQFGAKVQAIKSDLLSNYPFRADIVLANLPYVDKNWDLPAELQHEPNEALYAPDNGLQLIKKLLISAPSRLVKNGIVILEADKRQHETIIGFATNIGYEKRAHKGLAIALQHSAS